MFGVCNGKYVLDELVCLCVYIYVLWCFSFSPTGKLRLPRNLLGICLYHEGPYSKPGLRYFTWIYFHCHLGELLWLSNDIFLILFIFSPGWILLGNLIKFLLLEAFPGSLKDVLGAFFLWSCVFWALSHMWIGRYLPSDCFYLESRGSALFPLGSVVPALCISHSEYWAHMCWINTFFWRGLLTCEIKILCMCLEIAKQLFVDWISSD